MSVWQQSTLAPLYGAEGDLLSVRIIVEAFLLEDLLDTLAEAPFPINPEIRHQESIRREGRWAPAVAVEFPAWRRQIPDLEQRLASRHFAAEVTVTSMLEEIQA